MSDGVAGRKVYLCVASCAFASAMGSWPDMLVGVVGESGEAAWGVAWQVFSFLKHAKAAGHFYMQLPNTEAAISGQWDFG